jgi:hypothetical protein
LEEEEEEEPECIQLYIYKLIINGFPNSLLLRFLEWYLHPI